MVMRLRDEKKYESICEAAVDLINSVGFSNTSISKIAKRAGVSPATIYVYFDNKDDLLSKLYLRLKYSISKKIVTPQLIDMSVEDAFKTFWRNLYNALIADKRSFHFIGQFINSPILNDMCKKESMEYFKIIHDLYTKGKETGLLRDYPEQMVCAFTDGSIINLVKKHHSGEYVMNEDEVTVMLDVAWNILAL
jgi:AcrR family transcriptional regulator